MSAATWAEFKFISFDGSFPVSANPQWEEVMDEFDVLGPVAGRKSFQMRAEGVEIDIVPGSFVPLMAVLKILFLMIAVDVKPDPFVKIA